MQSRVVDLTGSINAEQRASLEKKLLEHESTQGKQLAVLIVKNTGHETLAQFGARVAQSWQVGNKEKEDGVVLIVAKDNPESLGRFHIEVGHGAQERVTNDDVTRTYRLFFEPHFSNDMFSFAISESVDAILARHTHLRVKHRLQPVPLMKSRVNGATEILKPDQLTELETLMRVHESRTGNQVTLLLCDNTGPQSIEEYAQRLEQARRIGKSDKNDGVILIFARNNYRAENRFGLIVGQGAKGLIPDEMAKRITLNVMVSTAENSPTFYEALRAGVEVTHRKLAQDPTPYLIDGKDALQDKPSYRGWGAVLLFLLLGILASVLYPLMANMTGVTGIYSFNSFILKVLTGEKHPENDSNTNTEISSRTKK